MAAVADDLTVGDDGEIPWPSLPDDRAQYRARVADAPVILGRRTFESMRDDLPGRAQVVLSRTEREHDEATAHHAGSVEAALDLAASLADSPDGGPADGGTAYVLGGAAVYALLQPHLDRMVLTRVPGAYGGDARYPEWDQEEWERVAVEEHEGFTVEEWVRVASGG